MCSVSFYLHWALLLLLLIALIDQKKLQHQVEQHDAGNDDKVEIDADNDDKVETVDVVGGEDDAGNGDWVDSDDDLPQEIDMVIAMCYRDDLTLLNNKFSTYT